MFERWLEALREVSREREEAAQHLVEELCRKAVAVALFGSRARGDHTPLSDWDFLAVVESGEYRVEQSGVGQIVWLPLDKLEDVLGWSMVILDAVADGKLLCGDAARFEELRAAVLDYARRRGLVRRAGGWFREPQRRAES
ncbi:DNA polymerase beta domain protein region [Thermoproteus uzoniensis 768-20]|uniref:DNA polymerase beta domain protein region n=1 Tax=Thermoproteus uzoniensis (strain 768-20) TaxID=999630 RepID=F2L0J1_THEU7|nr:nucleotidyltransferase domain-containing protein [Thermoproteus uzoniensis]AEA12673.1 DNA polymerase beta domain protein region [Thermoproteus uzoniensis 768-20]